MTDRAPATPATPVETAAALLDALREIKDDFQAVDSAVAAHVRGVRQRAGTNSLASRATAAAATVQGTVGLVGLSVGDAAQLSFGANAGCMFAIGVTSAAITHYFGPPERGRAVQAADERCDDFLLAGVAVELAMGEVRTALDDAQRGRLGSAEDLATCVTEAQDAFERYGAALQGLDENDLAVRFPWSQRDTDITVAGALMEVNAEAVLAQIRMAATTKSTAWRVPRPRKASTTVPRAGEVGLVIELAETLRQGLATAGDALTRAEEVLRQAARDRPDETLGRVADLVAQARMRAGLVEADCLLAETAARQAEAAGSAADGLRRIKVTPALPVLGNTFEGYVVSLQIAASRLAAVEGTEPPRDVGLAIRKALDDCPELAATASALISAIVTAWETIGGLVRS